VPLDLDDLHRLAILLDVDGTLLDIAPRPDEVQVPASLRRTLAALSAGAEGAVALVSGRSLANLDQLFAPLRLPAIGGHGAEMRVEAGAEPLRCSATILDPAFRDAIQATAARHPGVVVEDKGYSVALHFRLVPKQGLALGHDIQHLCHSRPDQPVELLKGKAVIEVKPTGCNKGVAVRELMRHPPFKGRTPIFVGDDITDEDAFEVMPEFGGRAISVGRKLPNISEVIASPAEVRRWLERLTERADALP
jgi:trehalose 6-phosphate phosphatase